MNGYERLLNVRVVLCEPSHPGNIGASARALKTMGLERLVVVHPKSFPDPEADARATGALDVLRSTRTCADLDEALDGTSYVAGLSARRRDLAPELRDVRTAAHELIAAASAEQVAVVFGTERTGLSGDQLSRCHRLVRIPANPEYSSLNLAASVQLVAYELRAACAASACEPLRREDGAHAKHEDLEGLIAHLEQAMRATGFLHPDRPGRLILRMRRMLARARVEPEEVAILRGFLHSVMDKCEP